MRFIDEFRSQVVFGLIHITIIISGILATSAMLKAWRISAESSLRALNYNPTALFVRSWGFTFLLIPIGWAVLTIWRERTETSAFSRRWTIGTGILIMLALSAFFFFTAIRPVRMTLLSAEP